MLPSRVRPATGPPSCSRCGSHHADEEDQSGSSARWFVCNACGHRWQLQRSSDAYRFVSTAPVVVPQPHRPFLATSDVDARGRFKLTFGTPVYPTNTTAVVFVAHSCGST